jgi:hypothetical protein
LALSQPPTLRSMNKPPASDPSLQIEKHPWGVIASTGLEGEASGVPLLPRDGLALVIQLICGITDARVGPVSASWGPRANMVADFAARTVTLDPLAQRALAARQALPRVSPGAQTGSDAVTRSLDEVVWDIGIVCGRYALLGARGAPAEQRLLVGEGVGLSRLLRLPVPLSLARLMFVDGGRAFTPAQAGAACGLSMRDTRGLLQACLFLGLLRWDWMPRSSPGGVGSAPGDLS